jgi:hypothetical protein
MPKSEESPMSLAELQNLPARLYTEMDLQQKFLSLFGRKAKL